MASSLASETRRNHEEIHSLQSQIIDLQQHYQQLLFEKNNSQQKLVELDSLIEQLLKLNESLITQLSGKPFKFHSKLPLKKKASSSNISKVPSIENIASEASKLLLKSVEKKGVTGTKTTSISKTLESIEQMKLMHKIYSEIARKMNHSASKVRKSVSPGKKTKSSSSLKKSASDYLHDDLDIGSDDEENELNYDSSASANKKTRIRAKKAVGNPTNVSFLSNNSSTPKVKKTKSALKKTKSDYSNVTNLTGDFSLSDPNFPHSQSNTRHDIVLPRPATTEGTTHAEDREDYFKRANYEFLNNNNHNHTSSSKQSQKAASREMDNRITDLEEEFNQLNLQYRNLLHNVSATTNNMNVEHMTSDKIQSNAEEIVHVIHQLHEKGEQIRQLKSPGKA
jgi:hypothetical protein